MEWGYLLTSIYNHYWAYFIQLILQVIDLHSDKDCKLLGGAFISLNIFLKTPGTEQGIHSLQNQLQTRDVDF